MSGNGLFKVVGGAEASDASTVPEDHPAVDVPRYKARMLKLLEHLREAVESNQVTGLVAIAIFENGKQSENAISECNNYELMGRIHAAASNINHLTLSIEEEYGRDEDN